MVVINDDNIRTFVKLYVSGQKDQLPDELKSLPIGAWDVEDVTDMSGLFEGMETFDEFIGNWDVRKVTNMARMFAGANAFNRAIGNWNVKNVTDMSHMFEGAGSFNQYIGGWNVENVTNFAYMFSNAHSFNQPVGNWKVNADANFDSMFAGAGKFDWSLSSWKLGPRANIRKILEGTEVKATAPAGSSILPKKEGQETQLQLGEARPWRSVQTSKVYVNVNQTVTWFDPIMQDEETLVIKDYLDESPENIAIAYGPDFSKFFFTDRQTIASQKDDSTFYPCKAVNTIRRNNLIMLPLYDLAKIGLLSGGFCDISILSSRPEHQLFAITETGTVYPSYASENVLFNRTDFVSALHCQEGQERHVQILIAAEPSSTGGRKRKSRKNKHKRRGSKKAGRRTRKGRKAERGHTKRKANKKHHKRSTRRSRR